MDDLISEFTAESREMLAALDGEVVAWEAAPDDRARLDVIFRCVHTIKGNSGFFDLPRLTALSHAAEGALAEVRAGTRRADSRLVTAILAALDRIGQLIDALEDGSEAPGDDRPLIARLSGGGGGAAASPAARITGPARSVRLPVELLDRMMNGISDLVLARNALGRDLREREAPGEPFDRLSSAVAELREAVTRTRMQRLETVFAPLPRLVRDLCAETGREAVLELDGGDVELDREMIELIRDPVVHMLRNALAHGIELPEARQAAGKSRAGTLRLCACQSGNSILIELSDDGAGVDLEALSARAVELGLLDAAESADLPRGRRLDLLFLPGLSTAADVSALAGRGVGMDVVRANVERIGGAVSVKSEWGRGTRFTLRVPLTLTIIPGLMVEAGGQCLAVPRAAVDEIVAARGAGVRLHRLGGATVLELRGRRLPVLNLAEALGLATGGEASFIVLLRAAGGGVYGLAVDRVDDHEELVVKPAAPAVMDTGLYGGTTLTEDGRPVLMIDPIGLAGRCGVAAESEPEEAAAGDGPDCAPPRPALLFTALCGARRAVPLGAVVRIDEVDRCAVASSAGRLHVALGERLLPLWGCDAPPQVQRFNVIRLSDGQAEGAYAAAAVLDTVELPAEATPVGSGSDIAAVALIGDEQVELVDLHRLFARSHALSPSAARPLCLLPEGDAWVDGFLRPLVESAGYATDAGIAAGEARLAIVWDDQVPEALPTSARLVRLRSREASAGAAEDSIYRYDRAALLRALGQGR